MAVAAAERSGQEHMTGWPLEPGLGPVMVVPELAADREVRNRAAQFIGAVATENWAAAEHSEQAMTVRPIESLLDAIKGAAEGDQVACRMVETNVATDVIERTIKAGHIMEVNLLADEAGVIQQHGQSMETVQANSLRFACSDSRMRERTEAETRNTFRIKHLYDAGVLKDYYFVVFSRAADDMSPAAMRKAGFFTDTMSCAIQLTSSRDRQLTTESAFVAGCPVPDGERHDGQTLKKMLARLGVAGVDTGSTRLLDTPLLIHKGFLPGGAADLVGLYDECAGGTFFGEKKPRQDYRAYRRQCRDREARFKPRIDAIVQELIAEAPNISSRPMATERLHKLSEKHMVELAVRDKTIDADVFGAESAARIAVARMHYEAGNLSQAMAETEAAVLKARSSSCPSARSALEAGNPAGEQDEPMEESDADCDFISKECPLCHARNVKTLVRSVVEEGKRKKHISGSCGCATTIT